MKGDFISAPYLSNLILSCGFDIIYSARERGFFSGRTPSSVAMLLAVGRREPAGTF